APNGASMRPNSPYQQSLVSWRFRGDDVVVYSVAAGTKLPHDLLLVHERWDHYSLQPAVAMTFDGKHLNAKLSQFFKAKAKLFAREAWLEAYPTASE
ncbi:hypothetical protein C8A03DRAFT_16804, partial [Achaetomium macrosporum]